MKKSPVWHPFTQHGLNEPVPLVTHAEGAALHTADGRRVIDAISSWWVTTHGHGNPRIVAAIRDQAEKLDQLIFAGWTHEPAETVARDLVAMMPRPLDHVFFSDSGSTSVEVAIKMALGHFANRGEPRHRIIVMQGSYHGDTIGGMSVGARGVFNRSYAPLLFDVDTIPFPEGANEYRALDALEQLCAQSPLPAAMIVEPLVLGAGGMKMYPPGVLRAMREICAAHGVLFIADEVMTGWGRTGTLLACEQAAVVPDLLCLSKGLTGGSLPLAVTMATSEIFESHRSKDRSKMFFHSSSYTANPIACAAAAANLAIWREEPVLERVAHLAHRQRSYSRALAGKVNNLRQLGTIVAMEVEAPQGAYLSVLGPRLMSFFRERNVLLRPLGNTVYVMPPYCISDEDLARVYAVIGEALEA
ncbi:adenosylmethionine--8-amino-7-oxononanoate transaminase [Sphingomonas koreensis]|jgi:adenosylmethionine-8-amino-7-oxononanoate aminotransferase|uniref:Adenosylmethionine-8-amino-7-oxononanoate aminotransferase n=1 Tax=Sphingomonas koreensis TaxID=93064 RepID=A0A1L6JDV6_9SPHN|nr:adenosylmethionine--8-amino-7-oxononanoate transaminase [Sphingomonas koreensis]APR54099.1 adenosylmethionine--8-amino-7-oxononanoate transaminase [Sphingomonas koreensis]MDC7809080.1 adenosylmethionine--8-amino-7-oxononanoate transaminase [Sphingomonas koreensis]RSU18735.1 adenosylmethionine--8-amino-7-oxononanoate transaminase [Sphingomonas koreensis]RSU25511.1 adenosylmethionine--8-amino-7-oxononanoate transaminase [Sphingomonas koreensis]RSU25754.1 adenosylmethionine--8-amino-7-oxononan